MAEGLFERFGKAYAAGDVIFHEGDAGHEMFVIQSGRVELSRRVRGREMRLAVVQPGEFFGEMAIVNNKPRSGTATVIEEARVLVLDAKTFETMIRNNSEIAVRMIKKLAARLAHANAQVEALLLQDLNHRVVHYLHQLAATSGQAGSAGVCVVAGVDDIGRELGADARDVETCLARLEQARLVHRHEGAIYIAEPGKLDQFLEFLDMKERFGG